MRLLAQGAAGEDELRKRYTGFMALPAGAHVGPYEILAVIGSGGMGEVYPARDLRLNRAVAIKYPHPKYAGRLEVEARAIAALNHPNICAI